MDATGPLLVRTRRAAASTIVAATLVALLALALPQPGRAAVAAGEVSATTERTGYTWRGQTFFEIRALRRQVEARGRDWNSFLRRHPAVVRAFALREVHWAGETFYATYAFARRLRARGESYERWARLYPRAAAALARNRTATAKPTRTRGGGTTPPASPPPASPPPPTSDPTSPQPTPAPGERLGHSPDNLPYASAATRDRMLDAVRDSGAKWLRFDVSWAQVQWESSSTWNWAALDAVVAGARQRGLQILGTLAYTPPWARPADCTNAVQCAPRNLDEYAAFAAAAAARYQGDISHWEIWNEPNWWFWRPKPDPARYAEMLRTAYPRIKAANPNAVVIAGATAPAPDDGTVYDEVTFLQRVYQHGGKGFFDAWSHHPYSHPHFPSFQHPQNAWQQMFATTPSIRSVLEANGDGAKKVWGTEYGSPTSGDYGVVSEATQAEHAREALTLWRTYPWAGVLFWYSTRDVAAYGQATASWNYSGLLRHDFSPKPAWTAYRNAATAP
jgi:polysaccharide biosynthesis protein PslG